MNAFAAFAIANAVLSEPDPSHREHRVTAAAGRRNGLRARLAVASGSLLRAVRRSDQTAPAADLRFVRTTSAWDDTVAPLSPPSAR